MHGYHSTTLEAIAAEVGISVPALYRHFPTKYALFAETSRRLADALRDSLVDVPNAGDDPRAALDAMLRALVTTTLANRGGGLYRWQSQFLAPDDADYVRQVVISQHRRVRAAVIALRQDQGRTAASTAQADALAAAAISAAGSPSTHRAPLPAKQAEQILVSNALRMVDIDLPGLAETPTPSTDPVGLAPASKREVILRQSIPLFAEHGFREVSIEDIARCAGMPPSGVYRHYVNKAAILQTAFWRANDRMIAAIDDALAQARSPVDAVTRLVSSYVELCSGSAQLIGVYMAEIGHVEAGQRAELRRQQRRNIDEWAGWVVQSRPGLTLGQARFMVHAALSIAFDLTRVSRPAPPALLSALICEFLLGDANARNV
ncbi:putative TetR family transcriptional regulator [Gordonia effusa NBRC 100432]|uniref:Putative TetR family transcriptional regulator n=1 Tax=Gordonia effusa NBRC 100432 TaxID=1077974 RepID=H0R2F5_9ACTN|nr:putative TetR family transcriptional regulator [Gordonia effusa NBRC 100432]